MKYFITTIALTLAFAGFAAAQPAADTLKVDTARQALKEILPNSSLQYQDVLGTPDRVYDQRSIQRTLRQYPDYRRWMFAIESGGGMRIAQEPVNLPDDLAHYRKGLKSGLWFGASAAFFVSPILAFGMEYSIFDMRNSTPFMAYEETPGYGTFAGSRRDQIRIHFIGPTLTIRTIPRRNKLYAWYTFMLGHSLFRDEVTVNAAAYDFIGNSFGFSSSVGVDFLLSNSYSAGVVIRMSAASVKNVRLFDYNGLSHEINNIDNLSRLSLALTFKTFR